MKAVFQASSLILRMGKRQIKWHTHTPGHYLGAFWGDHLISTSRHDLRKNCLLKGQEWFEEVLSLVHYCLYSRDTQTLNNKYQSSAWGYPWYELYSCPLGELAEKEEKETPQCCHGITHTAHAIPLAQPDYQPDVLFAGKGRVAGQWEMENQETELPSHCRNIPGSQPRHKARHCFLRDLCLLNYPSSLSINVLNFL